MAAPAHLPTPVLESGWSRPTPRLLAAIVSLVLVLAACGDADDSLDDTSSDAADATSTPASTPGPTSASTAATSDSDPDAPDSDSTAAMASGTDDGDDDAEVDIQPGESGCGVPAEPGRSTVSFGFEGRDRVYELVVPAGYEPDRPTPLVLNWHGLGSNGPDQLGFSEYQALADREGFLVAAPTGVPGPGQDANSWELTDDDDPTRDDLAFARAVLDRIIATTCVDEARVYTTGLSNGGYFSSRLVCELADRITAAASIAALHHPDDCRPSRPVPYLGFHGVDDEVVPYDGGGFSSLAPDVRIELFEAVIPDEFGQFAVTFGCDPSPVAETVSDDVTAFRYRGCPDDVEAVFYRLDNSGHTWPGSTVSLAISQAAGLGVTNTDVNASELSWEFFSRHAIDD